MKPTTLQDYKQRLIRVLVYIQDNLDTSLSLESLSRVACLSPYHFHRVFSGMIGETLQGLIRRLRMERAAWQLLNQGDSVVQIALGAGYESHEAFTRAFVQAFAMSPTRFRQAEARSPKIPARSAIHFEPGKPARSFRSTRLSSTAMNINIKTIPTIRVAAVRHVGPYRNVGDAWNRICSLLGSEGHMGPGTQMIGICYDDPDATSAKAIRYDACVSVDADFEAFGELTIREISGGDYAVTTHEGPYEQLNHTYRHLLGKWVPRSGRELAEAPCFEIYLTDPESTEPADLLTDVYAPLSPA